MCFGLLTCIEIKWPTQGYPEFAKGSEGGTKQSFL